MASANGHLEQDKRKRHNHMQVSGASSNQRKRLDERHGSIEVGDRTENHWKLLGPALQMGFIQ